MMNVRLNPIFVILVMIVESISAGVIRSCIQTCFNGDHTYTCCRTTKVDIVRSNGSVLQQRNSKYTNPLRQKRSASAALYISYQTHEGFTAEEVTVISDAIKVLANRLFTLKVRNCMYSKTGNLGYNLGAGVYARSNLEENNDYDGYKDLLKFQLDVLEIKAARQTFPMINIRPWHEQSQTLAKGTLGCITLASKGTKFTTQGQFNIWLNRYHLAAQTTTGSDSDYWAGVLVHEMLHNLGHSHDDYSDSWQINVFEKCLVQNGNYSPGTETSESNYFYYVLYH